MTISSILEIDGLSDSKTEANKLIVPSEYRRYFSVTNIPNIRYLTPNSIQVGECIFDLEYFYSPSGLIIKVSDFYSTISLKEIKVINKEEWVENGDDFVMKVNIEFVFAFDTKKKFTAYRLEY